MYGIVLDKKNNPEIVELATRPVKDMALARAALAEDILTLNQIYRQIPETECDNCGECCIKPGNPSVYSIEYLNMVSFINSPANKDIKQKIYGEALMGRFLLNKKRVTLNTSKPEKPGAEKDDNLGALCPALDSRSKLCLLYEYRPLLCRLYAVDGWYNKLRGGVNTGKYSYCEKLEISEAEQNENWLLDSNNLFFAELERLSAYYYIVENGRAVFNVNAMINWFTLKLRG